MNAFRHRYLLKKLPLRVHSDRESFYLPVFKALEYASGVGMGYVWIRFFRWLELPSVWYFFVLLNHGLVAGYRETRSDFGGDVFGPTVSDHFMVLDGLTGDHLPSQEERKTDHNQELVADSKLFESVRDEPRTASIINRLRRDKNPWVREYAMIGILRENSQ